MKEDKFKQTVIRIAHNRVAKVCEIKVVGNNIDIDNSGAWIPVYLYVTNKEIEEYGEE